jgi:hypothetical protein
LIVCCAAGLEAQDSTRSRVRVQVADSSGVRLEGVEITLLRGLHDTVARGTSSASGEWLALLPRNSQPYQVVVRKIGFARYQRFFMATGDSVLVTPRMGRLVQALAEVKISEKEDAVRKSYFIDADDIVNSPRPLVDASDILIKLRPDMVFGRMGKSIRDCTLENIWINGVAVYRSFKGRGPPPYPVSEMARMRANGGNFVAAGIGAERLTMLEQIKPEHIEQITYKDCFDNSMKGNFTKNALFIVLKPGIRYERGIGSYAIEGGRAAR